MPNIRYRGRVYHAENNLFDDLKDQYNMEDSIGNTLLSQHRQMHRDMDNFDRALGKGALLMGKTLLKTGKASWVTAKFVGKSSVKAGKAIHNRVIEQSERDRFAQRRGL